MLKPAEPCCRSYENFAGFRGEVSWGGLRSDTEACVELCGGAACIARLAGEAGAGESKP